jgi:putative tryptophan/tyrosine transport system substrate-binding protein
MQRRKFITLLGATAVCWPQPLGAQQYDKTYRIAVLSTSDETIVAFRELVLPELAKEGFFDGRNLAITGHFGGPADMPRLVQQVLAVRPDVVVASSLVSVQAMTMASSTIPIVMSYLGEDPVEEGLVHSLGRPGTNVTGLVLLATELGGKRVALLRELLPSARRLAILAPRPPRSADQVNEMLHVAEGLALEGHEFHADNATEYADAFADMRKVGSEALVMTAHAEFARDATKLAELAVQARIAIIGHWAQMARDGCLLAHGPHNATLRRRTAEFISRILRGASPSELPIEQPTTFEFVINLKTSKALGITIPPSLLARADEVIE